MWNFKYCLFEAIYGKIRLKGYVMALVRNKWHHVVDRKGFGRRLVVTVSVA